MTLALPVDANLLDVRQVDAAFWAADAAAAIQAAVVNQPDVLAVVPLHQADVDFWVAAA